MLTRCGTELCGIRLTWFHRTENVYKVTLIGHSFCSMFTLLRLINHRYITVRIKEERCFNCMFFGVIFRIFVSRFVGQLVFYLSKLLKKKKNSLFGNIFKSYTLILKNLLKEMFLCQTIIWMICSIAIMLGYLYIFRF